MDERRPRVSLLGRRWHERTPRAGAERLVEAGYPPFIAKLLAGRGIVTPRDAEEFLDAGLHRLADPKSLSGVGAAVDRILRALASGEIIGVFGDYDVDGQTATALMVRVLQHLGAEVRPYIPHRIKEGYGLNVQALKELKAAGCTLVITVDCGISAIQEAAWARENGIDLIITDHHQLPQELPDALAIINPWLDPDYPTPHLAGCGVAFKLAEALAEAATGSRALPHRFVDLVAVGTVADVVPLLGENRSLVKAGLAKINANRAIPGLLALRAVSGAHADVTAGHIAFILAPRLNAVGRIGDPATGLKLLLARSYDEALPLARRLEEENEARRLIEEKVLDEAHRVASGLFDPQRDHGLVVHGPGWHPGVIGIVASRLVEAYYRPTVVLSLQGDEARGSARSIPGFDLYGALSQCADLLTSFGGHEAAAGLTLPADRIDAFRERFLEVTKSLLSPEDLVPVLEYDAEVSLDEVGIEWVEAVRQLEPFGAGNPTPVVVVRDLAVEASAIGKDKTHLKLWATDPASGRRVEGIGFGLAQDVLPHLGPEAWLDIAFVPSINEWNGNRSAQMLVKDVRLSAALHSPAARLLSAYRELAAASGEVEGEALRMDLIRHGAAVIPRPDLKEVARALREGELIDWRGEHPASTFRALLERRHHAVVVPAHPALARDAAGEIASLVPEFRKRTIVWRWRAPGPLEELAKAALEADAAIVVIEAAGGVDELFETDPIAFREAAIVLWHAPADPVYGLDCLYRLRARAPNAPLVLATELHRDQGVAHRLEYLYPDRERLGRIWVAWKEAAPPGTPLTVAEIARQVGARWPGVATMETIVEAIAIFAELGLAEGDARGFVLLPTGAKVDLAQSQRYNEGTTIRTGYLEFATGLASARPLDVIDRIIERGTPWWPQSTSRL